MSVKPMSKKLTPIGRLLRSTRAVRFYHDGDAAGMVWRWWHPLSWVLAPLAFMALSLTEGFPRAWKHRPGIGFGMKQWFRDHPNQLEWDDGK